MNSSSISDLAGFTKLTINYNGAALCRVNSPIRKFSGSSSFIFDNNELLIKSEIKHVCTLEKVIINNNNENLIDFKFEPPVEKKRTYTLNKKIISRKIHSYFYSKLANKKFNFYSISFPLSTSDDSAFKLFNTVLTRLRKGYFVSEMANTMLEKYSGSKSEKWRYSVKELTKSIAFQSLKSYIWVAERQKNGTIHFHIITSDNINVLIFNHFVASYIFNSLKKHDKNVSLDNLKQSSYNGVDISKRRGGLCSVRDIRKYLTKYVTKNNEKFTHFAWHCSRNISALFTTLEFPSMSVISQDLPIDVNYKSEYFCVSEYYTFIFYPNINYEYVFKDLIEVNNDIIDCFFSQ